MKLIHYGSSEFDPSLMLPIRNCDRVKPRGGLWTSPIDSGFGWKDWCEVESFCECNEEDSFTFMLDESARVSIIDSLEDLKGLPIYRNMYDLVYLDFEKLSLEYDVIWLTLKGMEETRFSDPGLYGWDCESVLVMNEKHIKSKH